MPGDRRSGRTQETIETAVMHVCNGARVLVLCADDRQAKGLARHFREALANWLRSSQVTRASQKMSHGEVTFHSVMQSDNGLRGRRFDTVLADHWSLESQPERTQSLLQWVMPKLKRDSIPKETLPTFWDFLMEP